MFSYTSFIISQGLYTSPIMDESSGDSFEFGQPQPGGPVVDADRWIGEAVRWTLSSLISLICCPPPTQIHFLRRFFRIYSFHPAVVVSILLLGFCLSLQLCTFLHILLLGCLLLLCTLSVFWLCCAVLEVFVRIFNLQAF